MINDYLEVSLPASMSARVERTIFGPIFIESLDMEISAHEIPNHMKSELAYIFPGVDFSGAIGVVTMQHSKFDLVNFGADVDVEKDNLLEKVRTTSLANLYTFILICFHLFSFLVSPNQFVANCQS